MTATQATSRRELRERSRERIIEAATELVRERSYAELNVGEVMARAGIGRTIFYRHFDDLGDLLLRAGREAIEELFAAQLTLAQSNPERGAEAVRAGIRLPVSVYRRHGPVLRAVAEAVAANQLVAAEQASVRARFDELVAARLELMVEPGTPSPADFAETAHALNLMNETYLLEAFGREPRVSEEVAVRTLSEIWIAVLGIGAASPPASA